MKEFFFKYQIPHVFPYDEKYLTYASFYYRDLLKSRLDGTNPPDLPEISLMN